MLIFGMIILKYCLFLDFFSRRVACFWNNNRRFPLIYGVFWNIYIEDVVCFGIYQKTSYFYLLYFGIVLRNALFWNIIIVFPAVFWKDFYKDMVVFGINLVKTIFTWCILELIPTNSAFIVILNHEKFQHKGFFQTRIAF